MYTAGCIYADVVRTQVNLPHCSRDANPVVPAGAEHGCHHSSVIGEHVLSDVPTPRLGDIRQQIGNCLEALVHNGNGYG
ncbi:hypothetical protein BH23GEM7_BH23GEM7_40250 [soil metagenome]